MSEQQQQQPSRKLTAIEAIHQSQELAEKIVELLVGYERGVGLLALNCLVEATCDSIVEAIGDVEKAGIFPVMAHNCRSYGSVLVRAYEQHSSSTPEPFMAPMPKQVQ